MISWSLGAAGVVSELPALVARGSKSEFGCAAMSDVLTCVTLFGEISRSKLRA